ncbi:hypothetical protein V2J09_023492 [Rumex salicifolius]
MAAQVSRQIKSEGKTGCPITRDFLGGCSAIESKELDLDLQVPAGWEKRLDLKSGKVYIQRCIQPSSPSTNHTSQTQSSYFSKTQDLNILSDSSSKPKTTPLSLFEDTALDLKLFPNSPSKSLGNYNNATYQSVCTLDKVKSALDRAWRVPSPTSSSSKKRPSPSNSASSSMATDDSNSNSYVSSSRERIGGVGGKMVAGACPACLLYVLISESNPKCPKCNCVITMRDVPKKPKIDLNMAI